MEPIRVELSGALAGHHVVLDPDELTLGLIEDMQSDKAALLLDALANCIKGGDLPKGTDRAGLRRLKTPEIAAVLEGVKSAFALPKS